MGDISKIWTRFHSEPLAILPEKAEAIRAFLSVRLRGEVPPDQVEAIVAGRRPDGVQMAGRVAILPVFGVISQRVGGLERASGGVSTEEIGSTLDALVADKQVKAIVMAFDSPGGSVFGVEELAERIRAARDQKKIVGFADPMAASAAYWLMAQCGELTVTPSGQVGSIGVIAAHLDATAWEEKAGYKTTLVTSSPFKAELAPEINLSPEAKTNLQKTVNEYHGKFVGAIAKGRGVTANNVEKNFGQGRMLTAVAAKAAGMVDRIGTMGDVLHRLGETNAMAEAQRVTAQMAAARVRALEVSDPI